MRSSLGGWVVGVVCALGPACVAPPPPVAPRARVEGPPPAVAPAPPVLADADVIARSRAFLTGFDRHDAAIVEQLAPSFVQFAHARFYPARDIAGVVAGRRERNQPVPTRAFAQERVYAGPGVATYVTHSTMTVASGGMILGPEAYDTLVWTHDGSRWRVAHWQWQPAGVDVNRERWNEVYRQGTGFNKQANQLLVEAVKGRTPGTALDLLMGQGRNALFLASQGWRTTGVDIADEGLRQAREVAKASGLALDAIQADVDRWDLGTARWDLVTLIYAGDNAARIPAIQRSVRRGGLFVCEYFHADSAPAKAGAGGWDTGELATLFAGWTILRDEVVEATADFTLRPQKLVRFVAQKP